jgi:hypothetical protein
VLGWGKPKKKKFEKIREKGRGNKEIREEDENQTYEAVTSYT